MLEEIQIENLIYEIRGKQVMLDSDLAILYGCKNGTKTINQAVKRHINKFPYRFMFQLTHEEYKKLQSQVGTANKMNRNLPYVFTEEGVAMLTTVLRTNIAEEISIRIMDAFVSMRKFINENKDIFKRLTMTEYKLLEHDSKIDELFDRLEPKKIENQKIFFNREIYDSYSLITDINNLTKLDIDKFNKQYPKLTIKHLNIFHDRFIIIDDTLYHVGASLKDLGKKCFGITKISDNDYLDRILSNII